MAVYANEMQGKLDRFEKRLSGIERRSCPTTPQSAISVSDSQDTPAEKPDSSDLDSNPDEEEIARELGEYMYRVTCTCTLQ